MPLHAHNPVRIASPFHRLYDSIRGMCRDPQSTAGLMNRLVVRRIDVQARRAAKLQHAAGIELRAVHWVRTSRPAGWLVFVRAMGNFRSKLARDILDQAAPQKDIQGLYPVADRQHWLACSQSVFQNREISSLADRI